MPFVQYVASLAVLQAVQQQARSRLRGRGIDMRIKWPNDLYIGSLKVLQRVHADRQACCCMANVSRFRMVPRLLSGQG